MSNNRYPLTATQRAQTGHKVNALRREGLLPATIYGNEVKNLSLSVEAEAFKAVLKKAGGSHLVDLSVDTKVYPVLIHVVDRHPVDNTITHVEFYSVNLKEKLTTHVPVILTGESPAVSGGIGTLLTTLQEIEVETLPTSIPESVEVDISNLNEVDDEVKAGDITLPIGVTLLTSPETIVAKISALVVEVVEEAATPSEAEGGEETAETSEAAVEEEPAETTKDAE